MQRSNYILCTSIQYFRSWRPSNSNFSNEIFFKRLRIKTITFHGRSFPQNVRRSLQQAAAELGISRTVLARKPAAYRRANIPRYLSPGIGDQPTIISRYELPSSRFSEGETPPLETRYRRLANRRLVAQRLIRTVRKNRTFAVTDSMYSAAFREHNSSLFLFFFFLYRRVFLHVRRVDARTLLFQKSNEAEEEKNLRNF